MEVWTAVKLVERLDKLHEMGRDSEAEYMNYIINPYVTSLGYDVFNMDEVDTDIALGRMVISLNDDVKLVVSLTQNKPEIDECKVYLHVDVKGRKLSLYLKALNIWEEIDVVDITTEEGKVGYATLMRMVVKKSIEDVYKEKGERLFTEGVLRKKLVSGEYDNRFVREVIRTELAKPSAELLGLIAKGLVGRYSTDSEEAIIEGLKPLVDIGLTKIVYEVIEGSKDELDKEYDRRKEEKRIAEGKARNKEGNDARLEEEKRIAEAELRELDERKLAEAELVRKEEEERINEEKALLVEEELEELEEEEAARLAEESAEAIRLSEMELAEEVEIGEAAKSEINENNMDEYVGEAEEPVRSLMDIMTGGGVVDVEESKAKEVEQTPEEIIVPEDSNGVDLAGILNIRESKTVKGEKSFGEALFGPVKPRARTFKRAQDESIGVVDNTVDGDENSQGGADLMGLLGQSKGGEDK